MFRLLDASMELNASAGALNLFALWVASASIAWLVFALYSRQTKRQIIAAARRTGTLATG